jgi:branched-chain amino acid transport system permease protein
MRTSISLLLGGVALLAVLPLLLSAGLLNAAVQMLIAALFASAYGLLAGRAGMLSFGHAAYFGVGAFATVHGMNALGGAGLLPTPLMPLVGAGAGLVFGVAAGWFATQRSGTAFAMITLAIAELLHSLAPQLKGLFGGESGISAMRMPAWGLDFGSTTQVYYLTLAWVLISLLLLHFHTRTPAGRLTLGLRENSHRLRFLGYDVHRLSVSAFAISGLFSGVAGALQVLANEAANYVVFDPAVSASVVLNSYIGGVGVFLGPALGAALMSFFGYAVSDNTQAWLLYQGVLLVLVMMFMPQGLVGLGGLAVSRVRRLGAARAIPLLLAWLLAALLLAAGAVFLIELLQRLCSQDYRALAAQSGGWPPVTLLKTAWDVTSVTTWAWPLGLLALGSGLLAFAHQRLRTGEDPA